ncbi:hypothetical protein P280DRAFT_471656 [Massarina eburnea CBS 473.64]|uniref:Methyltransferase domain-containing protein n=1 Tax=Massarina eburnea CBS 473.64 TaxID=1395130 RepID=A0A6A6RVI1_9PLEO|nr:hypothetical protein P280DRAFT_471656 [Massarina eburnea CBS 473.64]
MPLKPPSFGSQDYWNDRFTSNANPFEWLEAPDALDPFLVAALNDAEDPHPQILHIGCGTSLLSYHLRAHVQQPEQVHNLDYSQVAVEIGRDREPDLLRDDDIEGNSQTEWAEKSKPKMRWSAANLLDHSSLLGSCEPSTYSVIVDKSTADCIACSDDVYIPLPYHIAMTSRTFKAPKTTTSSEPIHPLHILAVHLAYVAKPGARWIACSYSMDRFPFLRTDEPECIPGVSVSAADKSQNEAGDEHLEDDMELQADLDDIPCSIINGGFPDPSTLWQLYGKYEIEPPSAQTSDDHGIVHRPRILHWVYILERTDVQLHARS